MFSRAYLWALEASEGIWEIVVPVSYTHLDVYKRQVEAIVESINRYNELVAAGNGDEDFGKRDEYMAVSYTHLDTICFPGRSGCRAASSGIPVRRG